MQRCCRNTDAAQVMQDRAHRAQPQAIRKTASKLSISSLSVHRACAVAAASLEGN